MVWQGLRQPEARKPADGDVHRRFPHQLAVVHDAEKKARKHQPDRRLRLDPRPPVVQAVELGHLVAQPRQVQHAATLARTCPSGIRSRRLPTKNSYCSAFFSASIGPLHCYAE